NGNGTINIRATLKPTSVECLAGNDTVTVGKGGNMQAVVAPLSITHFGATGGIALTLDDSTDPFFRDVTMAIGADGFGPVANLAPATISDGAADVVSVKVNGGSGGNAFTVADTVLNSRAGFLGTSLNSGSGDDTVNVLRTTGALSIDLQGGS